MSEKSTPNPSESPILPIEDPALAEHMAYAEKPHQEQIIAINGLVKVLESTPFGSDETSKRLGALDKWIQDEQHSAESASMEVYKEYLSNGERLDDNEPDGTQPNAFIRRPVSISPERRRKLRERAYGNPSEGAEEAENSDEGAEELESEAQVSQDEGSAVEASDEQASEPEETDSVDTSDELLSAEDRERLIASGFSDEDIEDYIEFQQMLQASAMELANGIETPSLLSRAAGIRTRHYKRRVIRQERASGKSGLVHKREAGRHRADATKRDNQNYRWGVHNEILGIQKAERTARRMLRRHNRLNIELSEGEQRYYAAFVVVNRRRVINLRKGVREGIGNEAKNSEVIASITHRALANFDKMTALLRQPAPMPNAVNDVIEPEANTNTEAENQPITESENQATEKKKFTGNLRSVEAVFELLKRGEAKEIHDYLSNKLKGSDGVKDTNKTLSDLLRVDSGNSQDVFIQQTAIKVVALAKKLA